MTAACGGDEESSTPAEPTLTTVSPAEPDHESASAEIVLAGTIYAFADGSCTVTIAGDMVSQFADGDNTLTVTSTNHSVLIRATLDGEQWTESGDAAEPDTADASDITWSGDLLRLGTAEPLVDAQISLHC